MTYNQGGLMKALRTSQILAALFTCMLLSGGDAYAQAAHDTSLLTKTEREHFAARLSSVYDSAQRAKVKAEMNRLIQTRRLQLRQQNNKKQLPAPAKRP